jgi:hypothetical protein
MIREDSGSGTPAQSLGGVGWRAIMAVNPLQEVGGGKRQCARKHSIQVTP